MERGRRYAPLRQEQLYIDKTQMLEEAIGGYPAVFLEGAAASGKTTAVKLLLAHHPEVTGEVFFMDELSAMWEDAAWFRGQMSALLEDMKKKTVWAIFENCPPYLPAETENVFADFLKCLPEEGRAIFCGRERMPDILLDALWKQRLKLLPQSVLLFSKEETGRYLAEYGEILDPTELYDITGGWAGCVAAMTRLAVDYRNIQHVKLSGMELRDSYEIDQYIRRNILNTLSPQEKEIMDKASICPWLNGQLCRDVWGICQADDILQNLGRKGFLRYDRKNRHWRSASLFVNRKEQDPVGESFWNRLGGWYESHNYVKETVWCSRKSGDRDTYKACIMKYYAQIPFLDIPYEDIMEWDEYTPKLCYLRGIYFWSHQEMEKLQKEIGRLEKMSDDSGEIFLNLMFINPVVSLDEWLELLEIYGKKYGKIGLYQVLGGSVSYLCGVRDLTELFACSRKDENHKARIWRNYLKDSEQMVYQLARIEYYYETEREQALGQEDWKLLDYLAGPRGEKEPWQFRLVAMYLLCTYQKPYEDESVREKIYFLYEQLIWEEDAACISHTESIFCLYGRELREQEKLVWWLRNTSMDGSGGIDESNYIDLWCMAKGYLYLNQHERAGRILRRLIPWLQLYRRRRWLTESLFQQALVWNESGRANLALRNTIESFLINGDSRYVELYAQYGRRGKENLDAYVEWLHANKPEGWSRKKKYNYGNVLRMPEADYLEVISRRAKKEGRSYEDGDKESLKEKLTMTETIVLQCIGKGLTNQEICEELNLKLSTVKSHIYNIYKKIGAGSRVQAILIGKEMGVLDQ